MFYPLPTTEEGDIGTVFSYNDFEGYYLDHLVLADVASGSFPLTVTLKSANNGAILDTCLINAPGRATLAHVDLNGKAPAALRIEVTGGGAGTVKIISKRHRITGAK